MMDEEKPKRRKADVFAGEGSVAGNLRKRRESIESGDPSGGKTVQPPEAIPEKDRPKGSGRFSNEEIRRGFRKL